MARVRHKGIYHPKVAPPGASDPDSLWAYAIRFTRWQAERNYSDHTIEARERIIAGWATPRGGRGMVADPPCEAPV